MDVNPLRLTNPLAAQPKAVSVARPAANQPVDGYQPAEKAGWGDKLARVAAISATASGIAQLVGLGSTVTGLLGLGVMAAPVAVGIYLCKGGLWRGSTGDKLARVGALSLTATMAAAIGGASLPVMTALALPAIVAAPVAVGAMLWKKLRGGGPPPQQPPEPPVKFGS